MAEGSFMSLELLHWETGFVGKFVVFFSVNASSLRRDLFFSLPPLTFAW